MPTIIHLWFIIKVLFPLHFPQFLNVNEVSLKTNAESVYFRKVLKEQGQLFENIQPVLHLFDKCLTTSK